MDCNSVSKEKTFVQNRGYFPYYL